MVEIAMVLVPVFMMLAGLLVVVAAAVYLARRKIRKEFGLWLRHQRYKPPPPKRTLHF